MSISLQVDIFEVLIVQQPAATVASLSSFAKTSSSKMMGYNPEVGKGLPPRLGVDSNLDELVSFLENHRLGAHPPQELACLASNPQSPSGISAFALDNGRFEPAAVVMERASNQQTCNRPPQANVVRATAFQSQEGFQSCHFALLRHFIDNCLLPFVRSTPSRYHLR